MQKKFKFNVVDAIVILVLIAVVAFVGFKFFGDGVKTNNKAKFEISFYCEEVPSFAAEVIKVDDPVTDDDKSSALGYVTKVNLTPSRTYADTSDGRKLIAPKEGYNTVEVKALVEAEEFPHGIVVNAAKYGVGHSLTIRVGYAKIYGRVSGLKKID